MNDAYIRLMEDGKMRPGGEVLAKGAKMLEESDYKAAVRMYMDAVEAFESDERGSLANDIFRNAVLACVRKEEFTDAVPILIRMGAANSKVNANATVTKVSKYLP